MQLAGGGEGGIAELFGCGDGQDDVVRRELLGDGQEVDGDTRWGLLAHTIPPHSSSNVPCSSRDVPSGTYLTSTLRRRYSMKP